MLLTGGAGLKGTGARAYNKGEEYRWGTRIPKDKEV